MLRLVDYRGLGGLEGALNQRAGEVYAGLSEEQQEICRSIFLRLVQPGEGTEDTRRRANLSEFGEDDETAAVVQKLADVRLITTQQAAGDREAFAEVTHEALIRNWGQLREWIEENRESLKQRIQISQAAAEWEKHRFDDAWLLTGTRLGLAEEWRQESNSKLSQQENEFLNQCRLAHEQRIAAESEKQERQVRLMKEKAKLEKQQRFIVEEREKEQQKSLKFSRLMTVAMALLAAIMLGAAFYAVKSEQRANDAANEAEAKRLDANYNLAKVFEEKANFTLSRALGMPENLERRKNELRQALLYTLEAQRQEIPSGKTAVQLATLNRLSLVNFNKLAPLRKRTSTNHLNPPVTYLSYSPDGNFIATISPVGRSRVMRLWDASYRQIWCMSIWLKQQSDPFYSLPHHL